VLARTRSEQGRANNTPLERANCFELACGWLPRRNMRDLSPKTPSEISNFDFSHPRSIVRVDPTLHRLRRMRMRSRAASRWHHPALQPGWIDRPHQTLELGDLPLESGEAFAILGSAM
jgi:hypothetical protein